jgi:hypothetical protein
MSRIYYIYYGDTDTLNEHNCSFLTLCVHCIGCVDNDQNRPIHNITLSFTVRPSPLTPTLLKITDCCMKLTYVPMIYVLAICLIITFYFLNAMSRISTFYYGDTDTLNDCFSTALFQPYVYTVWNVYLMLKQAIAMSNTFRILLHVTLFL